MRWIKSMKFTCDQFFIFLQLINCFLSNRGRFSSTGRYLSLHQIRSLLSTYVSILTFSFWWKIKKNLSLEEITRFFDDTEDNTTKANENLFGHLFRVFLFLSFLVFGHTSFQVSQISFLQFNELKSWSKFFVSNTDTWSAISVFIFLFHH